MAEAGDIEIIVKAAGTDEAVNDIEETEEALAEAGESMSDTSDDMGDLQGKMQGLGGAIVGSLAVMTAGILSQVPVLGEAFSGLAAVASAVGYQMDSVLRPVLGPVADGLFTISEAIFNAEGPLGTLVGILGTLAAVFFGLVLPIAKVLVIMGKFVSVKAALVAGAKLLIAGLSALAGAISLPVVAIAALIAGIILAIEYFIGWGNIFDFLIGKANGLVDWLMKLPDHLSSAMSGISEWTTNVTGEISDLVTDIAGFFTGLATDAADWGRNLLESFAEGITDSVDKVTDGVKDAVGSARDYLPFSPAKKGPLSDLDKTGPAFVETVASGIEGNASRMGEATGSAAGETSRPAFSASRDGVTLNNMLDGRDITEDTGRYRRDGTARRFRNG